MILLGSTVQKAFVKSPFHPCCQILGNPGRFEPFVILFQISWFQLMFLKNLSSSISIFCSKIALFVAFLWYFEYVWNTHWPVIIFQTAEQIKNQIFGILLHFVFLSHRLVVTSVPNCQIALELEMLIFIFPSKLCNLAKIWTLTRPPISIENLSL